MSREEAPLAAGRWLVLADRGGVGERLAASLEAHGGSCVVAPVDTTPVGALGQLVQEAALPGHPLRGVIHLWALDQSVAEDASAAAIREAIYQSTGSALELVKNLVRAHVGDVPRLWFVTRGAQPAGPVAPLAVAQAPLWGLAKVVALEHPELVCRCIDLNPADGVDASAGKLLAELISTGGEGRIAIRPEGRLVPRLVRSRAIEAGVRKARVAGGEPYELNISTRGVLDNLSLRPVPRRAPGLEVEIRVRASGLNFRDVLNAVAILETRAARRRVRGPHRGGGRGRLRA